MSIFGHPIAFSSSVAKRIENFGDREQSNYEIATTHPRFDSNGAHV